MFGNAVRRVATDRSPSRRERCRRSPCWGAALLLALAACEEPAGAGGGGPVSLAWTHRDPAGANAIPFADEDIAVFTTEFDRRVVALDARTGAVRWRFTVAGGPAGLDLPEGNVLGVGGLVVVPAWDLYGLDRGTGQVRWTFAPADQYPAASSAASDGAVIYTPGATALFAVDAQTGAQRWRADLGERPFAPVVANGVVYVGGRGGIRGSDVLGAGHVFAIRAADGEVLWKVPVPDQAGGPWQGGVNRSGAVAGDVLVIASTNGSVYGIERATGEVRWRRQGSGPYESGVAMVGGVAVAADLSGEIVGLDPATGALRWRATTGGSSVTQQVTSDGRCAYVSVGGLMCVDAAGTLRWDHGGGARGGPDYFTSAVPVADRVYIGSAGGFHALTVRP